MIKTSVKIQLNDLQSTIDKRKERGQAVLDEQVLKDSNNYAPQDTSELIRSSLRSSQVGQGQIIYDTKYARINYYGVNRNFSTDKNVNAGPLWFERAKANHLQDWLSIVAKTMGGKV